MDQWYVAENGAQVGPLTLEEVRRRRAAGALRPDDLVWAAGMADWQPASAVAALGPDPSVAPAPPAAYPPAAYVPSGYNPSGYIPHAGGAPQAGPAMLAYATPGNLTAIPAAVIPPVRPDDGPFRKLGKQFNTGRGAWFGPTAVSPVAFYFVKRSRNTQSNTAFAIGGLAGALVASAIEKGKTDDTRTCTLAELPPAVRQFLSPKGKMMDKDVIVVPRETARRVSVGAVDNHVVIRAGDAKLTAVFGLFRNGSVKRFLTGNGWTINADLQPTAAPVFGHSFGRAEPVAAKTTHPALRALYIILAVVLVGAFIYLRVAFATRRH